MASLMSVDDLPGTGIEAILRRATALRRGAPSLAAGVVGLLFLTPSMRTRVGFEVAGLRLGGSAVHVDELRVDEAMSAAESLPDAMRTLAGMVDALVVRAPTDLEAVGGRALPVPVINGGDATEHPTQALIDLAAIEHHGAPGDLTIALVGDLRMRAATSLIRLLRRRGVGRLIGVHPPDRGPISSITSSASMSALADADVVVMIGLPPGGGPVRLSGAERAVYALDQQTIRFLRSDAVILSPMPVIDEIADPVHADPRVKMFEQSDHGLFVRMAILEWALTG